MTFCSFFHGVQALSFIGATLLLTCQSSAFDNKSHQDIRKFKQSKEDDAASQIMLEPRDMITASSSLLRKTNRALAIGDFELFNELFQDAQILLLESETLEANGGLATLNIENLVCTDFYLGDLQTNYEILQENGKDVLAYTIKAQPFAMRCSADYSFRLLGFIPGNGRFSAATSGNMVETRIDLISPRGFDSEPPTMADVEFCNAEINVDGDIDFQGNALDQVLEFFSDPIENLVKVEAAKAACNELESLGPEMFSDLLNTTKTFLDEWLQPIPAEMSDPLTAERNYVRPDGVKLVNFQKSTGDSNSVVDMIVDLLKNADQFLGGASQERRRTAEDLGVNNFIRNAFLDETGAMTIVMDDLGDDFDATIIDIHDKLTESVVKIERIKVFGLDSLTTFNPFVDIGEHTLSNELTWEKLALELDVSLRIKPSTLPDSIIMNPGSVVIEEDVQIKVEFSELDVVLALFMAIDQDKLEDITVGTILDDNLLSCLSSTMNAMEVSGLDVSIRDISDPTMEGFISPGLDRILSQLAEAGFRAYEPTFLRAIPYIFQVPVRNMVNDLVDDVFDYGDEANCPINQDDSTELAFVDFRDLMLPAAEAALLGGSGDAPYGSLISGAFELMKKELLGTDPDTGLATINSQVIASFTESQSGTPGQLSFPGDLIGQKLSLSAGGLDANIELRASDLYVNNLDTIGVPLTLLDPMNGEPHMLSNSASIGSNDRPLQFGINVFFALSGEDSDIRNEVDINLDIYTLQMLLNLFAKVSERSLLNFPIRDFTNLNCWLATIPPPQLDARGVRTDPNDLALLVTDFVATVENLGLNVTCVECTGPKMSEFASLDGSEDLTEFANSLFGFAVGLVEGNFLQVTADRALHDARKQCPHSSDYDPNFTGIQYEPFAMSGDEDSMSFVVGLIIAIATLVVAVLAVVVTVKLIVRRRNRKWIESIPAKQANMIWQQQDKEKVQEEELNASTASMIRSAAIPLWLRLAMPFIILGNIALFLSGHLSLGGSVTIRASIGGQSFSSNDFYDFSILGSTIEMWNAGAKELAMLIFILSFAWPYSKQLLTLFLWVAPPRAVSVKRRGSILLWLDALAKWSMADIFVLVVTIVCFRVSVQSPGTGFLPDDFYSLDLLVIPKWGLYANMTAQLISQVSSHFIIHYHRRIVHVATDEADQPEIEKQDTVLTDDAATDIEASGAIELPKSDLGASPVVGAESPKTRLCEYAYRRPHRGESDRLVARRAVNPLLIFFSMCLCALIIAGCVVPSYSLNVLGIVGLMVESGQAFIEAHSEYSVFTTIQVLFDQARFTGETKDYIGLGTLSIILILTVLVVPLLQIGILLVQWFVPATRKRRNRLSVALEVLQAWQYVEVYLLSVLVGSWQLGPISEFMINPYCESLNGFFSDMVYYGILKEEDARCFKTDMKVEPTFYILLAAAVLLGFVNSFIAKAASQYFQEVDEDEAMKKIIDLEDEMADEVDRSTIHPTPVLFTDRYRWLLHREDVKLARTASAGLRSSGASTSESEEGDVGPLPTQTDSDNGAGASQDITSVEDSIFYDDVEQDQQTGINESTTAEASPDDTPEDSFADAPPAFQNVLSQWKARSAQNIAAMGTVDEEERF